MSAKCLPSSPRMWLTTKRRDPPIRHPVTMPSPAMVSRMEMADLVHLHDFKVPKISSFELEDGRSFYAAFTVSRRGFGTLQQCQLMQQLLYSILYSVGIRNEEIIKSPHAPLTKAELRKLPCIGTVSAQAWLLSKARWRLKILNSRLKMKAGKNKGAGASKSPASKFTKVNSRSIPQKIDPSLMKHVWQKSCSQPCRW